MKEITNLKECVSAKDANITILREKLKEKNERIVEADRLVEGVKTELEVFKARQIKIQEE